MGRGKGEVWSSGYREEEENMIEKRNRNNIYIAEGGHQAAFIG